MPNGMRWVGLDVHAHASAVAVFDDVTGELITRRVIGRPWELLDVLRELPGPLRAVYEAGPTEHPALIDHAWRVQRRLNARWNQLPNGRGKPAGIATIAIARELVGARWEIATAP
jgi:hypothetical protein